MNIANYTSYFHDGTLYNIVKVNNEISFQMSSAEVELCKVGNDFTLSEDRRIQGILHLFNVRNIHLTGKSKIEDLFQVFNLGTILDFEIINNTVELGVLWENCPPKVRTNEFTTIVIGAEFVKWENIPDLKHRLGVLE